MANHHNPHGWVGNVNDFSDPTRATAVHHWVSNTEPDPTYDPLQSYCDLGEPCDDGACNPQAIIPCASFEPQPCYDPNCAPSCELDGMNLACTESHNLQTYENTTGVNQQIATSQPENQHHHPQTLHGQTTLTSHYRPQAEHIIAQAGTPYAGFPSNAAITYEYHAVPCYHPEEHAGTGCINPRFLYKKMPEQLILAQQNRLPGCCCDEDPHHTPVIPNLFGTRQQPQVFPNGEDISHIQNKPGTSAATVEDPESARTLQSSLPSRPYPKPVSTEQDSSRRSSGISVRICEWMDERNIECGCEFTDLAKFQHHVETYHLPKQFKKSTRPESLVCRWLDCKHAAEGKSFKNIQHLRDHTRTHTGDKPHVCHFKEDGKTCGLAFAEKKALQTHRRTHTNERPYKCSHCTKKFKHNATMKTHEQTHQAKPKKYKCPKCEHKDNDRANLTRHIDTHYDSRFSCKMCRASFSKKANAHRHLSNRSCKKYNKWPIEKSRIPDYIEIAEVTREPINFNELEICYNNADTISLLSEEDDGMDHEEEETDISTDAYGEGTFNNQIFNFNELPASRMMLGEALLALPMAI